MQARKVLRFFPDADRGLALLRQAADALLLGWGAEADILCRTRDWIARAGEALWPAS